MARRQRRLKDQLAQALGYQRIKRPEPDFDAEFQALVAAVGEHTMTSPERIFALREAVRYVVAHAIPGALVECGVWKGGSMMAIAKTLLGLDAADRELYLFDTFEGMTPATDFDVAIDGSTAADQLEAGRHQKAEDLTWAVGPLTVVKSGMQSTGYPDERIVYVQGPVEETLPAQAPEQIALLRLDTDWYESTYHELVHLFPRLSVGGVLIIDDYGHWEGAKRAVDQYIAEHRVPLLLNRIDYSGRIAVKLAESPRPSEAS